MTTLKEKIKEIYKQQQQLYPTVEEEIAENFKRLKDYYQKEKEAYTKYLNVDKIVDLVLKHFLNPKNVDKAIRLPLNVQRLRISNTNYAYYLGGNYYVQLSHKWRSYNVHPVVLGNSYQMNIPDNVIKNPNPVKRKEIVNELITLRGLLATDLEDFFINEIAKKYEELLIEKINSSGIKYSIKTSKYGGEKWILMNIPKTKQENVSEEFLNYYNELNTAFYGG